ncbi:MAG TPA: hypothetical protein PL051_03390 [Candidatus Saccharibacteria bacterium]|nr:hypothetical protein [Candidatus Saccharibacteria bacterium]
MTSKAQLQEQVNNLRWDLSSVRDGMARRDYRQRRTDSWLDRFPEGVANALGVEQHDFVSERWTSTCVLGNDVAKLTVDAVTHRMTFQAIQHETVPNLSIVLDDDPDWDDLRSGDLAEIEEWFRWASTGEKFDPAAAAEALNAL